MPPAWGTPLPNQQPQPTPVQPKRKSGSGTKWLVALLIVLVVLGVLVVTVPDRETHRQAIVGSSREWVNDKVEQRDMGDILGEVVKWVTGKGADLTIDQLLQVDNHFVYSTGKLMVGDEPKTISLGILGHVFTFSKDDLERYLQQAMGVEQQEQQPSVGVTPPPAEEPVEPEYAPDDTLGSVMPREDDERPSKKPSASPKSGPRNRLTTFDFHLIFWGSHIPTWPRLQRLPRGFFYIVRLCAEAHTNPVRLQTCHAARPSL